MVDDDKMRTSTETRSWKKENVLKQSKCFFSFTVLITLPTVKAMFQSTTHLWHLW